ncbi:MAG: NAD(P)/FAD-dependent oxidoreductase [Armatimonadetes bacterium]|nr:NAD(P)/FAD-dependent oxidoreductase [Armatimonadota bacterium]
MREHDPGGGQRPRCRCVVIGGGPAGLTCALYLARFNCETAVVTRDDQRARLISRTYNVPGYPDGISGADLIERCREHARRYGVRLVDGDVDSVEGEVNDFRVRLSDGGEIPACHVVLATGVVDVPPDFPNAQRYVGRGLRHCPVCDGYEANGRRLAIFGGGSKVARHALYLTTFTEKITILLNGEGQEAEIDPSLREDLARHGIPVLSSRVVAVLDDGPEIRGFRLEDGTLIEVDRAYSALDVRPRSDVARKMEVRLDRQGYICVDAHGRTNVEGVYAVGDVVNRGYAQIIIGMAQAATAAIHINARHLSEP